MASKKLKLDCREETNDGQETERGNWDGLPPEVLNMILNRLPVADLLACSVVSKNWKKASRDVLKRGRECYAYIMYFPQDVQDLNDMIASSDLIQMVNGLHIRILPKNSSRKAVPSSSWRKASYPENVLHSIETRRRLKKATRKLQAVLCGQWKYLNLDIRYNRGKVLLIEDALLLRELISATSESLQKLVVAEYQDCDFISCCGKEFSKLKVLHAHDGDSVEEIRLEKFVLESAPNLEEITGVMLNVDVRSPWNSNMLKRMKSISVAPDDVIPEAGLMESFRSVSGLYQLNLRFYERANSGNVSILFLMVLNSLNTLEELHMYTLDIYDLCKTSRELKFPNLRRLTLATHHRMPIEQEIFALKWLNLPTLCPNLEQIEIDLDECYVDYEEEEIPFEGAYDVYQSNLPLQIKLKCSEGLYRHEHLKFLNQIYPKTNKVQVVGWRPGSNPEINNIFSDIHSLEYLEIKVSSRFSDYNDPDIAFAAILCGINIEEAKFLFSGLSSTNAALNSYIVPIHPSVFNAKNLKKLKITGEYDFGAKVRHRWVIDVTENLPVRHVRKLKLIFKGTEGVFNKLNDLRALRTFLGAPITEN